MSKNNSILTVGSMAFDSIKTPHGSADTVLGGSVNYFSVAASFFTPVQIVAVVGQDFPKSHLEKLGQRRIDVSGVEIAPGETFKWVGEYTGKMNEATTLSTALNVFETFQPKLQDHHRDASYVFLGNIDPTLQKNVLQQVRSPELIACDTMNLWITNTRDALTETIRRVDILSINEGEASMLSGKENLLDAAKKIQSMGPSVLLVKRGEYGAVLFGPSGVFLAPAFPTAQVTDPTGAGDSFAGGFMGYLAEAGLTRDTLKSDPAKADDLLRRATVCGCVMASFTVEDFSLRRIIALNNDEIVKRQNELMGMIRV